MQKFRKIWDAEKNAWLIEHHSDDIHESYILFINKWPDSEVTETAYRNQRVRLGLGKFHRAPYSTKSCPIGTEHEKRGYIRVKIAQPNTWKYKHHIIYEKTHPEYIYQKGDCFIFLDRNRKNFAPDNIEVIPLRIFAIYNALNGENTDPAAARVNIARAKLKLAVLDRAEKIGDIIDYGAGRRIRSEYNEKRKVYVKKTQEV